MNQNAAPTHRFPDERTPVEAAVVRLIPTSQGWSNSHMWYHKSSTIRLPLPRTALY